MNRKLTAKQLAFCQEYLIDKNATQACIRAGYSVKSADVIGSELLRKTIVSEEIARLTGMRSEKTGVTAEKVLKELHHLAHVDLSQAYDKEGFLKSIHDIPEDIRRAISGIEMGHTFDEDGKPKSYIKKLRFVDKAKAIELIGKHLKMFTDKVEHSGQVAGPQVVIKLPSNGRETKK